MHRSRRLGVLALAWLSLLLAAGASAQLLPDGTAVLHGTVTDGPTGAPIVGAVVRVGDTLAVTDELGVYQLTVPAGEQILEVSAWLPDGQHERVRQPGVIFEPGTDVVRDIHLVTGAFLDELPVLEDGIGVPMHRHTAEEPEESEPIDLIRLWLERAHPEGPTLEELQHLELPDPLPATIRVLRRYPNSCTGTDYPVTEVDLDTYAAGVVTAEIGVFRALTTGQESQRAGFEALAIAGRTYALWFWARNPDAAWHLDDTACNQRYTDGPYPQIIQEAAEATSGQVLVMGGTEGTIDKFEYAASCGRCGSQPEYQDEIVPDDTGQNACTTGGWCGHNNCAGHADNPDCPLEGPSVRCLVRGICQWGLAERSARGDTYDQILGHYQPNLDIRDFNAAQPARLLGFVRAGSVDTGEGVAGARVTLDTGQLSVTSATGLFTFEDVEPGLRTASVEADGYFDTQASVDVLEGVDNWRDIAVSPRPVEPSDAGADADAGPVADPEPGDTGTPDSGAPTDLGPDANTGPDAPGTGDVSSALSRFALVGEDSLDPGCGCGITRGASTPTGLVVVLMCAVALLGQLRRWGTRC